LYIVIIIIISNSSMQQPSEALIRLQLAGNFKPFMESKYQKTLKIATISRLSLTDLQLTEMLWNSPLLIVI